MPFQPRIAIVGGGPSGLALGLLLQQRGIRSVIYELRNELAPEELAKPSGMLDLHEESGLKVMRECGLWDDFQAAVGDCSEACRILDPDGTVLHTDEGELASRPEIPRHALTQIILNKLDSDIVKWSHKITSVEHAWNTSTEATEIELNFGDNGTATYDFVVGADGAWSRVRKILSNIQPTYTGAQYVTATVRNVSTNYPHLLDVVGSGTLMALGGWNGILTHRGPQDSVRVYAAVSTPHENWAKAVGLEGKSAAGVKAVLLSDDKLFRKWAPQLQDLLAIACDEETNDNPGCAADILPLYTLPVGNHWVHRPGATLIGDAAHLMGPRAGEGVNLALRDSLELANVLGEGLSAENAAAWQAAVDPLLDQFETAMMARVTPKAEETVRNQKMLLAENGGQALADLFKSFFERGPDDGPPRGQREGR